MIARSDSASVPTETVVQFVEDGLCELLVWWMDGKMRTGVEEVNTLFRWLKMPAATASLGSYLSSGGLHIITRSAGPFLRKECACHTCCRQSS